MSSSKKNIRVGFADMLATVVEQGQKFIAPRSPHEPLIERCKMLVSTRGEASGTALAKNILDAYELLDATTRLAFFHDLAEHFDADADAISKAAQRYSSSRDTADFRTLVRVSEPGRRELFRRLNQAPNGTRALTFMRADLLKLLKKEPSLSRVDFDLELLLRAWYNRGFLDLIPIDWDTSASILDKLIEYEAVHEIDDWDDLRRRLQPSDRRCFAFFHPRMPDEPLIFVQVALMADVPTRISDILDHDREPLDPPAFTTAVFYSITNCQVGLRGISFGNFLIKQVASDLSAQIPQLKNFVTLSPVPGLAAWVDGGGHGDDPLAGAVKNLSQGDDWLDDPEVEKQMEGLAPALAADYLLNAKAKNGQPVDPVARFHLGNGAVLDRVNWLGDQSAKGKRNSYSVMVNYRYNLTNVEENHEKFAHDGTIAVSRTVSDLANAAEKRRKKL